MIGFLIEYHRPSGDWNVRAYTGNSGVRDAMLQRFDLERLRDSDDFEIVVLTAPNLEILRRTHSRYFGGREREPGFSSRDAAA